jgi:queuosine precursor transporter
MGVKLKTLWKRKASSFIMRLMFGIEKLDFLVSLYTLCVAISELMGLKTFHIVTIGNFPLNASVAIFVVPVIFLINDIINEVYGREKAKSIVRSGLFMVFLIFLFSILATHLPASSRFAPMEKTYDSIFFFSARIAASSLMAFAISQFLDIFLFAKVRNKTGKKALWLRTNVSNFISEFFDSFIFIFLAFYALDKSLATNVPFLLGLILPYWFLKCFVSLIETPFVYIGVEWLKGSRR